ncbi:MAG: hypothetical protein WCH99_08270 [Verrucomicrobiota bacterium]
MGIVDFILNLAGLLLWLNWRSIRFDPLAKRTPATLTGTLRPADPHKTRRWHLLAIIAGLLVLRAMAYRWIGPLWVAKLDLVATTPQFRSNLFPDILFFSFMSFGLTLGGFYASVLLLSLLQGPEPIHRLIKIPMGRVDEWPAWAKVLLPFAVTSALWWGLSWPLDWMQKLPVSLAHRCEQSLLLGLASYGVWKFPAGALLTLHLLNSYIYFGKHPFWKYVSATAQTLLRPLKSIPLRIGRVDFAPVAGIAIIFLAAEGMERGLVWLYAKLPF